MTTHFPPDENPANRTTQNGTAGFPIWNGSLKPLGSDSKAISPNIMFPVAVIGFAVLAALLVLLIRCICVNKFFSRSARNCPQSRQDCGGGGARKSSRGQDDKNHEIEQSKAIQ